jgi:RNA polymerase sigma-70 factor (ECF subfamily)
VSTVRPLLRRSAQASARTDPFKPTDAELLEAVGREDLTALGTLFDRHHERVLRVLLRTGVSWIDADDLVQATFLEVVRLARSFDGRDSSGAWLCGIAIRLAARQRRSFGRLLRRLTRFGRERPSVVDPVDPERQVAGREELGLFASALAALSQRKREAFVMVDVEGFSAEEVGCALGVNPATIRTRLFHARQELRSALRDTGC